MKIGDIAFTVNGFLPNFTNHERLVLNVMQRMSAISTLTDKFVQELKGFKTSTSTEKQPHLTGF